MKTSYPELRGKVVKITAYSPTTGQIEVESICVGAEYFKGITLISASCPSHKFFCLNRDRIGHVMCIPDKATYRLAFHATIKAIKAGHLDFNQFFIDINQPLAFHIDGHVQCAFE